MGFFQMSTQQQFCPKRLLQTTAVMETSKISPDTRAEVIFLDDAVLAYMMTRYSETMTSHSVSLGQTQGGRGAGKTGGGHLVQVFHVCRGASLGKSMGRGGSRAGYFTVKEEIGINLLIHSL